MERSKLGSPCGLLLLVGRVILLKVLFGWFLKERGKKKEKNRKHGNFSPGKWAEDRREELIVL